MVSNIAFQYTILGLIISIMTNVLILLLVFASGIGKRVLQRLKQRWMYKWGKHVNVLFLRRNHVSHELFLKKEDDGSFEVDGQKYSVNPLATFIHDGIPTQINKEGDAEAFNIYNHPDARTMSTAELENIIMANEVNDLASALKKFFPIFLIFMIILVGFIIGSAYFNWKIYDEIVQKHLLDTALNVAQNATATVTAR